MENIALSTAAFCLWQIDAPEKLRICKQLNFSQIEVALSTERMVQDFLMRLDSLQDLNHFQKIAIHAPWCGIRYGDNNRTRRVLNNLAALARKIPVDAFVFHVDCIENMNILVQSGLSICLENSDRDGCWEKFKAIASEFPLPLALNVNRATRRQNYLDEMLSEWGHRITRIQVSGYGDRMGRTPIVSANQLDILKKIQGLSVPLILEGLFDPGDCQAIVLERQSVWNHTRQDLSARILECSGW